jgi:hypothetical protein
MQHTLGAVQPVHAIQFIHVLQKNITQAWDRLLSSLRAPWLRYAVLICATLCVQQALAADFDLPKVDAVTGLDGKKDPMSMIAVLIKFVVKVVLWILVIGAAVVVIKNIVKEVNKVRRDEEGKWGAVVGDIIGNISALLATIAFSTWVNSLIA